MHPKLSGIFIFIIVLATFITGAITYPQVSDARLAFGLPVVMLALGGLWALLPAIDPVAKGFVGFRYVYDFFWILLIAVLAYSYALKLEQGLGFPVDPLHAVIPAVGLLVFIAGALLPMIKRNWFFGIRTPWTLLSDEDWNRTHRFGRPVFMIAGVLIMIGNFTPRAWSIGLIVAPIIVGAIACVVYSYVVYKKG